MTGLSESTLPADPILQPAHGAGTLADSLGRPHRRIKSTMSAGKQPGTQIKLTNVSVVRLKKAGKRFEVRTRLHGASPGSSRVRSP